MPRYARKHSSTFTYHIMLRGNEGKKLFLDDDDKNRFVDTLRRMKEHEEYEIYTYCLMDNHVHLLISEKKDSISRSMKRICVSYAYYFNKKYSRTGHLFQDRYRSEVIDGESYLLTASRYIHNNPVKAQIVKNAERYKWSSIGEYLGTATKEPLVKTEVLLSVMSNNAERAVELFREYTSQLTDDVFIDYNEGNESSGIANTNGSLKDSIEQTLLKYGFNPDTFRECRDKRERNQIIREIKENYGGSVRELARILHISKDVVFRA